VALLVDRADGASPSVLVDAVIYGGANSNRLTRPGGAPAQPDVGDVAAGFSIARFADGWRALSDPTPGSGPFERALTPQTLPSANAALLTSLAVSVIVAAHALRRRRLSSPCQFSLRRRELPGERLL